MFLPKEEIEVTSDLAVKYTNAVAVETALLQQANAYPINGKIPAATNNRVYELQLLKKTADGSYVRDQCGHARGRYYRDSAVPQGYQQQ